MKEKILIVSDSSIITGVYNYVLNTKKSLEEMGHEVKVLTPRDKGFVSFPTKVLGNLRWTLFPLPKVFKEILRFKPDYILITSVEAPLGMTAKHVCVLLRFLGFANNVPYIITYTTDIKRYYQNAFSRSSFSRIVGKYLTTHILSFIGWSQDMYTKFLYSGVTNVIVITKDSMKRLQSLGIRNVVLCRRGIDEEIFRLPNSSDLNPYLKYGWYKEQQLPILLYLGRVSLEKNLEAFLDLKISGYHKVVVGDGPELPRLKAEYGSKTDIHFLGSVPLGQTAPYYQYARLSFFPSKSDVFGNTIIESCACGTPVVAFNVQGPKEAITEDITGVLVSSSKSLCEGIGKALVLDREKCSRYTREKYSWLKSTKGHLSVFQKVEWKR